MTTSQQLAAENLTLSYGDAAIIEALDLEVVAGKVTAVVGANGCGKATLLRALARLIKPRDGRVLLDGTSVSRRSSREVARTLGLLPESPLAPERIAVADLVGRGRHPHQRPLAPWSKRDYQVVADALEATSTADLADRSIDELSGASDSESGSLWPWLRKPTSCCLTNRQPFWMLPTKSKSWTC